MVIKGGCRLSGITNNILIAIYYADLLWQKYGRGEGVCITSALDGEHMKNSKHYIGDAVDLRIRYFDQDTRQRVYEELKAVLGGNYDVLLKSTHIHVEYDEK